VTTVKILVETSPPQASTDATKAAVDGTNTHSEMLNQNPGNLRPKSAPESAGYRIALDNGTKVEFYFRSVYGTYMFISQFVPDTPRYALATDPLYAPLFTSQYRELLLQQKLDPSESQNLFEIKPGAKKGYFVKARYADNDWSVDENARSTKMVFAVLHQRARDAMTRRRR